MRLKSGGAMDSLCSGREPRVRMQGRSSRSRLQNTAHDHVVEVPGLRDQPLSLFVLRCIGR